MLQSVKEIADAAFDTTTWSPHQLSRTIEERYANKTFARNLYVTIASFGFKYGQYRPCDSIYDVRFLDNPHFVNELREKTGLNKAVKDHVFSDKRAGVFLDKLVDLHEFLLPQYFAEGKHYFRIGIGCTGGKHRSVCIAEELSHILTEKQIPNILISVAHRDLGEFNPPALR